MSFDINSSVLGMHQTSHKISTKFSQSVDRADWQEVHAVSWRFEEHTILEPGKDEATFFSYAFFSNRAFYILSEVIVLVND